jgi:tRNA wybutosine-synthesizing protein 3
MKWPPRQERGANNNHEQPQLPSFRALRKKNLEAIYGRDRSSIDKSPKGSVDEHIQTLVDRINYYCWCAGGGPDEENYVTLSSCSGRICVYDPGPNSTSNNSNKDDDNDADDDDDDDTQPLLHEDRERKTTTTGSRSSTIGKSRGTGGSWLLVDHDEIAPDDLLECIAQHRATMTSRACFRFEPFLLHVAAANLRAGQQLLQVALQTGLRESGLVVTNERVTVALRTTALQMAVPLVPDLPLSYVTKLVQEANERLRQNWSMLCRLQIALDDAGVCTNNIKVPLVAATTIPLPDLNIYGNGAAYDAALNIIVSFGGYGSGPHSESPSRSTKWHALSLSTSENSSVDCTDGWKSIEMVAGPADDGDDDGSDNVRSGSVPGWSARQGAAVAPWRGGFVVHGGRRGQALGDLFLYQDGCLVSPSQVTGEPPTARWGHTITPLSSPNTFLLVGGRSTERLAEGSLYLLSILNKDHVVWKRIQYAERELEEEEMMESLLFRRFHHAAVSLGNDRVFIYGGLPAVDCLDPLVNNETVIVVTVDSTSHDLVVFRTVVVDNSGGGGSLSLGGRFGHQLNLISSTVSLLFRILLSGGISNNSCNDDDDDSGGSCDDSPFVWLTLLLDEEGNTARLTSAIPVTTTARSCGTLVHHAAVSDINDPETVYMIGGGCQGFAFRDIYAKCVKLQFGRFRQGTIHQADHNEEACQSLKNGRAVETNVTETSSVTCSVVYVMKQNAKTLKTFLESAGLLDEDYKMCPVDVAGVVQEACITNNAATAPPDWTGCIAVPVPDGGSSMVEHELIIGRGMQSCPRSSKSYAPRSM